MHCPSARATQRHPSSSIHIPSGAASPKSWVCEDARVPSPQSLSEADRRLVAAWAADCAERVLVLFEERCFGAPGRERRR